MPRHSHSAQSSEKNCWVWICLEITLESNLVGLALKSENCQSCHLQTLLAFQPGSLCNLPVSQPQQLCSGVNNYEKGLWTQSKNEMNSSPAPKPAKPELRSRSGTLGYTRILFPTPPPPQQNVKNVLNEKFSCYK